MTNTLWFVWMMFICLFLVSAVGYGWSYRGWGPPLPRYLQRRRALRLSFTDSAAAYREQAWGWAGDLVWVVLLIGCCLAAAAVLLR